MNANQQQPQQHERTTGNYQNAKGKIRCRFDLFVRWPEWADREKKTFCYRGDAFDTVEAHQMLKNLLRCFKKNHQDWVVAELYDNTIPKDDERRVVLKYSIKDGEPVYSPNRLEYYKHLLFDFPMPDYLKTSEPKNPLPTNDTATTK